MKRSSRGILRSLLTDLRVDVSETVVERSDCVEQLAVV